MARVLLENAAVRVATAGDHFANAHVRLAWEANAATTDEVLACKFDPAKTDPVRWISVEDLRAGLERLEEAPVALGVLSAFALTESFSAYIANPGVREVLGLRHAIIHRERPSYAESPSFGRATRWVESKITLVFPPPGQGAGLPTIRERQETVWSAIEASFEYASDAWALARRWLASVDVDVTRLPDARVEITTRHGARPIPHPRPSRDPAPFLKV